MKEIKYDFVKLSRTVRLFVSAIVLLCLMLSFCMCDRGLTATEGRGGGVDLTRSAPCRYC
jgi:hypothetical protein